jgi:uroporphyrin-III C-methyltransferase/precorrin-2 dehydrogenase/sirohydrochlorin ferrochelatase
MDSLPVHLRLSGQRCLVIGGGLIAQRKCDLLLKAGALVTIVAPDVIPELAERVIAAGGMVRAKPYDRNDLKDHRLVIAATDKDELNQQVFEDAEAAGVFVNVVDAPALCRFIFPAIIDRSPLVISAGTTGAHPVLARQVRTQLETLFPAAYGAYAQLLARYRAQTKTRFSSIDERRLFWEDVLEGPIAEQALAGNIDKAEKMLQSHIDAYFAGERNDVGEVYVVGAGPGDPDLLTFRALRLLQKADVVIYDRLVGAGIVELARRDAEKIYAGKARGDHALPQEEINAALVRYAKAGKRVCRLKGGDPFIFGRGGEEIGQLMSAGIPFQVVPGVTAAAGCAAYAGIPLTHRDYAQSVRFVTGHMKNGHLDLPWASLVNPHETLVFYMGLNSLPVICAQLVAHGLAPDCPAALVEQGTLPAQKVYSGQVVTFADVVDIDKVTAPALLIIGRVVGLRDQLQWFEGMSDHAASEDTEPDQQA